MVNAVEIENLSKTFRTYDKFWDRLRSKYREVKALKDVSLTVKSGEIFGLLGPNGAGKTTMLNIISTLVIPDSGSVKIFEVDTVENPLKVRNFIGLSSAFSEFPHELTVRENLEIFALHYDVPANFNKLIKLLELRYVINKQFRDLSSGNKQRIVLAKSLMVNPRLLLLDELTVALDPSISRKVRKILSSWQRKKKRTIMLATRNMYEADALCDRLAIIHLGKIIALGTPAELKKMLREEDTVEIKLVAASNSVSKIEKLEGINRVVNYGNRIVVHVDEAEKRLHKIIDIIARGNKILSIKTHEPTLEDVFIKLTGARLE